MKKLLRNRTNERSFKEGIYCNDKLIDNKKDIANKFNQYFIESITEIVQSIGTIDRNYEIRQQRTLYEVDHAKSETLEEFNLMTIEEVGEIITALPNKKGTREGISTEMLKLVFHAIGEQLTEMINDSLRNGLFPAMWKRSEIIPIPKVNKAKRVEEFRPINMLPQYEKLL